MANNSNFTSNFSNTTSYLDILSSVSTRRDSSLSPGYYSRYFYLGNLLIQFSDISQYGIDTTFLKQTSITLDFPVAFSSKPYCVFLTTGMPGTAGNANVTLNSFTNSTFTCNIAVNNAYILYFAIGPR